MDGSTAYYERMKHMREALSIAGMQSSDWLRFEAALKAARKFSARAAYGSGQLASYPSLPTTIGNELRKTLVRAETCRSVLESADALYAVLSGKQRVLADRLLAPLVSEALTANATCIDCRSPSPRGGDAPRLSPPPVPGRATAVPPTVIQVPGAAPSRRGRLASLSPDGRPE